MTILKLQGMQPTANLTNGAMSLSLTSSSSQCCNSGTKDTRWAARCQPAGHRAKSFPEALGSEEWGGRGKGGGRVGGDG